MVVTALPALVNVYGPAPNNSRPAAVIAPPTWVTAAPALRVRLPLPTLAPAPAISKPPVDLTDALLLPAVAMVRLVVTTSMPSVAPIAPKPAPSPVRLTLVAVIAFTPVSSIDLAAKFTVWPVAVSAPVSNRSCVTALVKLNVPPVELDVPKRPTRLLPVSVVTPVLVIVNVPAVMIWLWVSAPFAVRLSVSPAVAAVPTVKPVLVVLPVPSLVVSEPIAIPPVPSR